MTSTASVSEGAAPPVPPVEVQHTRCCVVGGGPAGAVLSLLLARQGVEVTRLESHKDFDRDFRGDTLDAVEASNVLGRPLREGRVTEAHLAQVQRRREWPTRIIQAFQAVAQKRVLKAGLEQKEGSFRLPLFMRLGWVRRRVARLVAFGVRPAHVEAS